MKIGDRVRWLNVSDIEDNERVWTIVSFTADARYARIQDKNPPPHKDNGEYYSHFVPVGALVPLDGYGTQTPERMEVFKRAVPPPVCHPPACVQPKNRAAAGATPGAGAAVLATSGLPKGLGVGHMREWLIERGASALLLAKFMKVASAPAPNPGVLTMRCRNFVISAMKRGEL